MGKMHNDEAMREEGEGDKDEGNRRTFWHLSAATRAARRTTTATTTMTTTNDEKVSASSTKDNNKYGQAHQQPGRAGPGRAGHWNGLAMGGGRAGDVGSASKPGQQQQAPTPTATEKLKQKLKLELEL
ncbi:hypothetical protein AWZ03_013097 [Drosophila navojoa]|uniref:Uncharacterized protein n=1 Tax=Drosophila navojoa TaxID=7232 RepID=A0A484AXA2_DRONA|nr:hypothetical protein AWZ03_013097 [Drosophila navojoa]